MEDVDGGGVGGVENALDKAEVLQAESLNAAL